LTNSVPYFVAANADGGARAAKNVGGVWPKTCAFAERFFASERECRAACIGRQLIARFLTRPQNRRRGRDGTADASADTDNGHSAVEEKDLRIWVVQQI